MIGSPELVLLGEPTTGVDPTARRWFRELIRLPAAEGTTIVRSREYGKVKVVRGAWCAWCAWCAGGPVLYLLTFRWKSRRDDWLRPPLTTPCARPADRAGTGETVDQASFCWISATSASSATGCCSPDSMSLS